MHTCIYLRWLVGVNTRSLAHSQSVHDQARKNPPCMGDPLRSPMKPARWSASQQASTPGKSDLPGKSGLPSLPGFQAVRQPITITTTTTIKLLLLLTINSYYYELLLLLLLLLVLLICQPPGSRRRGAARGRWLSSGGVPRLDLLPTRTETARINTSMLVTAAYPSATAPIAITVDVLSLLLLLLLL